MKLQILKTGLVFLALNLILVFTTNAQVGIGTTDPKSSLQVEGNPSDTTTPDGVQVPSLTITQLEGKIIGGAYGADQDGAIVYISDASIGSTISETADVKNKGFYYYFHNGVSGVWRVMGEQKIDLTNPDRVPRWDGTNLIEGSIIDSGGNVGIGTLTPDALLDVEGSFQFKDGTEGDTKLLTSDSDGNATWQSIKPENFLGTGNAPQPDFNCLSIVGSLYLAPFPESVAVSGNYAYVVDSGDVLNVIDVSNPSSPMLSGSLGIGSDPSAVAVSGNYAYVVDISSDDLKVIDVSNPANPLLSGTLGIGSFPLSVAVTGNYAYVVDQGSDDLKVIDVSNPASPILSGSLGIESGPREVTLSGNYAYVVDVSSDELKVIDVSNPANPILSGTIGIGTLPNSVAVSGNYAYVVDSGSDDLKVIDVSNPASPILSGILGIGPVPFSVAVSGNYAYVVDLNSDDLKVIDVSNPSSPLLLGSLDIGSYPLSVAVSGNYAYVVDQDSGDLKIIELYCSPSLAINPLTGNFETVTESDPQVASITENAIPKWDGTSLVDGSIIDVDGNVSVSSSANTTLTVQSPDDSMSMIRAIGNSQGTGAIEVGQSETFGGGLSYNGDNNPVFIFGEFQDHITFYRLANGIRFPVFYYSALGDNVVFNGSITSKGNITSIGNLVSQNDITANGEISWNNSTNSIGTVTGQYGSVQVNGGGVLGWEGFSINGRAVFMHDGSATAGIYDDANNHWLLRSQFNGGTYLYYNGSSKMYTNNDGIFVDGRINTGQGANELYDMNQNVLTNSDVTFNDINVSSDLDIFGASGSTGVPGQTTMYEQIRIFHPLNTAYHWSIGHQTASPSSTDDDLYFYVNKNGTQNVAGVILDQNPTTTMNFTGQHRSLVDGIDYSDKEEIKSLEGLIVVADKNQYLNMSGGLSEGQEAITINEALPIVSLSAKAKDKSVFGVISTLESEDRQDSAGAFATPYDKEKGDERFYINSVGEGGVWIVDMGQSLESGDYIQTSNVKGYGMRQDDDLLHNYTVAKITMDCDFEPKSRMKRQIKRIANEDGSYENVLDQFGRVEWEPMLDGTGQVIMELPYKMRYLSEDGDIITKEDYGKLIQDGKKAYRAAFVGCTYHCG